MSLKSSCSSLSNTRMPDKDSLHRSFNQLLGSLDLPKDKIKEMNSYDNHKKWEILCSRSLMKVHQSPSAYLKRLKISPTRETLRGLEVSLRTYPIEWLHEFVIQRNWLDIFVNIINIGNLSSENFQIALQCLRVMLMSDSSSSIINHPKLLESLVNNLLLVHHHHRSYNRISMRNQTLILQLLAIACKASIDGQRKILESLKIDDRMRQLMDFLTIKCIDQRLISTTLNLIRAILDSTTDISYRIYLQYGFHEIGLDDRIERLMLNESNLISEVIEEITAYKSMIINVNQLIKDRECIKTLNEKLKKSEMKIREMEKQLINYKRNQEVEKKDGLAEMSEESKVDKIPDVSSKTEISRNSSTMRIAPMMKCGDTVMSPPNSITMTPPPMPPKRVENTLLLPIKKNFKQKSKFPALHWSILRPHQICGTIFSDIYNNNNDNICKAINFNHFEDKFRIVDKQRGTQIPISTARNPIRMPNYVTLLESNRLRNVSILLRKLNLNADVVVESINDYNFNQLKHENVELLTKLAPTDEEISSYRHYIDEQKDIVLLSDEDKFLLKLSLVERLHVKLNVMEFMGNFNDRVNPLIVNICAISSASLSLKSSQKFKDIIEIILTFGNYMNGNKSTGYAYGFRMKGTLEKLNDIRSNDKKQSLLQYIVNDVIAQHFSQLLSFDTELLCIHTAAHVSMKNVANEVGNIQYGWREMSDECDLSLNTALSVFKETSYGMCNKLINEFVKAQNNYKECMEYFGVDATIDSDEFFTIVEKFVAQFMASKVKCL